MDYVLEEIRKKRLEKLAADKEKEESMEARELFTNLEDKEKITEKTATELFNERYLEEVKEEEKANKASSKVNYIESIEEKRVNNVDGNKDIDEIRFSFDKSITAKKEVKENNTFSSELESYLVYAANKLNEISSLVTEEKQEEYNNLVEQINLVSKETITSEVELMAAKNHVISLVGKIGVLFSSLNNELENTSRRNL